MSLFGKKTRTVPQSYQPPLDAPEIIELFSRLTLHHQAALLRLISRNMIIEVDGDQHMGFEFEYGVDGALVAMRPLADDPEPSA
jgi:hypothetical protein